MNSKFYEVYNKSLLQLNEENMPSTPPDLTSGGGAPDVQGGAGSALPGVGGLGGDSPEGVGQPPKEDMDNSTKRDTDPIAYTQETLSNLIDPNEGISPKQFNEWIDTFGVGATKIKDKEGFKQFYNDFYNDLIRIVRNGEKLKKLYSNLHSNLTNIISTQNSEPDNAGGGINRSGPSGPGVR